MSNNFDYSIKVSNLNFSYPNSQSLTLENIHLSLVPGSRCLLIGENGSGKSTLLRVLAGRHLTKSSESVELLGRHSFHDTKLNFERVYIDTECSSFTADIPVHSLMKQLQDEYPERRDELIKLLGIDLNWRMHQVSVGERRRIQIFLGLLRPSKIMLLDDVSTCLDITSRNNFIQWLKRESQEREVTIMSECCSCFLLFIVLFIVSLFVVMQLIFWMDWINGQLTFFACQETEQPYGLEAFTSCHITKTFLMKVVHSSFTCSFFSFFFSSFSDDFRQNKFITLFG